MKKILFLSTIILILSCTSEKIKIDLLVKNANVYTVNDSFEIVEAFVVNKGKIVAVGLLNDLETTYKPTSLFDAQGDRKRSEERHEVQ